MKHEASSAMAAAATLHCLTGCSIGEIAGMAISALAGWGNLASVVISFGLSFVFGYTLSSLPLLASGLPVARVAKLVLVADTLSILTMEVVDNGFVLIIPNALSATLADPLFWWSTVVSLLVAFAAAFPVNRWLLGRGQGHAITHGAQPAVADEPRRIAVPPTNVLAAAIAAFMIGGLVASLA